MILTGFTDEAATDIDKQIAVTHALGWNYLSARTVGSANIHDISESDFETFCNKLETAKLQVAEFGTLIGSWSKSIQSPWAVTVEEINRCIPRMQRLGVKYARIMSYAQEEWGSDQQLPERIKRLREINARFSDAGIQAVHENCMNYGGFSADHTLELLDIVPGLKLVFDTGNPVFQTDRSESEPFPWQNSLEFFRKVKHAVVHIHVKDAIFPAKGKDPVYTFAGDGDGHVSDIMKELIKDDYQGFIAIEPHMGKVFHEGLHSNDPAAEYNIYRTYGQKFESLLQDLGAFSSHT